MLYNVSAAFKILNSVNSEFRYLWYLALSYEILDYTYVEMNVHYLVCHITSARPSNVTKVMHEVWMQLCAEVALYFIILFVYLFCLCESFFS